MNSLHANYQAVINHVADDIQKSEQPSERVMLQERHDWLVCRRDALEDCRERAISGFNKKLEAYLHQCETFWKERHERTYEAKMDELLEVKKRVSKIYALTGYDACNALMLAIKPMRSILPLRKYDEYAPALAALEHIKSECYEQLGTYLKF